MRKFVKLCCLLTLFWILILGISYAGDDKYSGFLGDYPQFEKGKKGVDLVWIKEGVDWKKYDKIMMDQLIFYFADDSKDKSIDPEEMKQLSDAFHQAFVEQMGSDMFTYIPGPDVIRIRIAITQLKKSRPGMNVVTTVMPIGLGLSCIKKVATGSHTAVGGATAEMEFLDSVSNERLVAAIDKRSPGKLEGYTKWGAVKDDFEFWAKRIKVRFDELRGIKPSE